MADQVRPCAGKTEVCIEQVVPLEQLLPLEFAKATFESVIESSGARVVEALTGSSSMVHSPLPPDVQISVAVQALPALSVTVAVQPGDAQVAALKPESAAVMPCPAFALG